MKPKTPQEQAAASRQVDLLTNALDKAKDNNGVWMNGDSKVGVQIHDRKTPVSPFNAMILALFSDAKGYPTNRFTSFSDARQRGDSVMKGELGVPFLFYKWDKYVNRGDKNDVLDREAYKALSPEEQKNYRAVRQREVRTLFNLSQTTLPFTDREGFAKLVRNFGPATERAAGDNQEATLRKDVNRLIASVKENLCPIRRDTAGFARYDAEKDAIYMPDQKSFANYPDYVKALVSQIVTATGHGQRLAREGVTSATEDAKIREQLVNELTTGVKLQQLGLQARLSPQSLNLVEKWNTQLREDPCLIDAVESDMNNALAMIAKAERGEKVELATDANKRQTQEARDVNRPQVSSAEALVLQDILAHGGMGIEQRNFPGDENKSMADMKTFMEKFSNLDYYRNQVSLAMWNAERYTKEPDPEHPDLANVAYTAAAGEAARIYEKCTEWMPREWEEKGPHFVADELLSVPDRKSKEFVVVADKETGIVDIILPGSARRGGDVVMPDGTKHNYWMTPDEVMLAAERKEAGAKAVTHNLPGFNKDKISAALMAQGATYVRFFNTDGILRYHPDDAYFENKNVYAARLNGKEVSVTANFDVSDAVHRSTHQAFDRQQMLRSDDGKKWLLYMKPEGQKGFAIEPSKEDVNRFFTAVKSGDAQRATDVRDELAQKYYAESVNNPSLKQDIFNVAPEGLDLSLIDRVNVFRTKDDKLVCLATIQGVKGLQPMEISKPQWEKMWLADDMKDYKTQLAGLLYADTLRETMAKKQEAVETEKKAETQKPAEEAKRQAEEQRKAEEQKKKYEAAKEKVPNPVSTAIELAGSTVISLTLLKQQDEMKKKHPDAVLLFHKGDDYVILRNDATRASEILGIPVKSESVGDKRCDYATFRHHDLDPYLPKLVRAGCRVAICEQLEDPKLKTNRVERGIGEPAVASEPKADYSVIKNMDDLHQKDNAQSEENHIGFHR